MPIHLLWVLYIHSHSFRYWSFKQSHTCFWLVDINLLEYTVSKGMRQLTENIRMLMIETLKDNPNIYCIGAKYCKQNKEHMPLSRWQTDSLRRALRVGCSSDPVSQGLLSLHMTLLSEMKETAKEWNSGLIWSQKEDVLKQNRIIFQ